MPREKLNILVHGVPKSGKTTMAVRRNPNAVVMDTEGSSKFITGIKRVSVTSMGQMDLVLNKIRSGEVKVVIIDTLDELVNNFAKEEVRRAGGNNVQSNGQLSMQGWGILRDRFLTLTRAYRDAGADVLTVCHSELIEQPEGGKKWTMKLPSDYAREVMGMMDVVGFLGVVKTPDGKNVRRLYLTASPAYDAGVRTVYDAVTDKTVNPLPDHIDDPAFVDLLTAYDKAFQEPTPETTNQPIPVTTK